MGENFTPDSYGRVRGITGPHRIKGIPYDSLSEACTILGFEYDTIYNRMARYEDLTAEEAMYHFEELGKHLDGKKVTYNGKEYRSIKELGDEVGLSSHSISRIHRRKGYPYELCVMILKTGYSLGQLFYHEGQLYVSQVHLCEAHGTTQNRVKSIQKYHDYESFYDAFIHYLNETIPKPRKT